MQKIKMMQFSPTYIKLQWGFMLFILFIDVAWIGLSSFEFYYNKSSFIKCIVLLILFYLPYLYYKKYRPDPRIMTGFISALFIMIYSFMIFLFSYLVFTTNFPLYDSVFAQVDAYLGFNSPSLIFWFRQYEWLQLIFYHIYGLYYYLVPFVILYFSFYSNPLMLQRFIILYMLGTFISLVLAGLFPGGGTYYYYNFQPAEYNQGAMDHFFKLRQNIIDIRAGHGLIVFPSFHATAALLYIYTFRYERMILFIPILIANLLVVFSCLPTGEHYLIDVLGGIVVFLVVIGLEHLIYRCVQKYGIIEDIKSVSKTQSYRLKTT